MSFKNATMLFEITQICNQNCIHCFRDPTGKSEMTLAQIRKIFEKISAIGIQDVVLTGGEPLLREDFFKIVDILNYPPRDLIITDIMEIPPVGGGPILNIIKVFYQGLINEIIYGSIAGSMTYVIWRALIDKNNLSFQI
ncbi:MAG: radical SAM protein [Promethearchaeota archaeon]